MIEVLSLGAGVQSTAVLLMSIDGDLPPLDHAIFADTGWEPPAVYEHLDWLKAEVAGRVPIHTVTAGNIRDDHVSKTQRDGQRTTIPFYVDTGRDKEGRTLRKCTLEYKIEPIERFMRRDILGLAKGQHAPRTSVIRHWFGISVDEYKRAKPSRNKWKTHWHPLVEQRISRTGCLKWLADSGYPKPPRSACVGCPFRSQAEWRDMKTQQPDTFDDASQFDAAVRNHAALSGPAYLHRSLVPLSQVDFRNDADRGQLTLWDDECEGMCGV